MRKDNCKACRGEGRVVYSGAYRTVNGKVQVVEERKRPCVCCEGSGVVAVVENPLTEGENDG